MKGEGVRIAYNLADVIYGLSLGPHLPPQEYKDGRVGDDGDDERHVERAQCRVRLSRDADQFSNRTSVSALIHLWPYCCSKFDTSHRGQRLGSELGARENRIVPYAFIGNILGNSIIGSYLIIGSII